MSQTLDISYPELDITLNASDYYDIPLTITDSAGNLIDLTAYSIELAVRNDFDGTTIFQLNTARSGITIVTTTATIHIRDTQTATLNGPYRYDVKFTSGAGIVTHEFGGIFTVKKVITP